MEFASWMSISPQQLAVVTFPVVSFLKFAYNIESD